MNQQHDKDRDSKPDHGKNNDGHHTPTPAPHSPPEMGRPVKPHRSHAETKIRK